MSNNTKIKDLLLLILAIIFSVALMFAFIELPRWIDSMLQQYVGFPGFDQGANEFAIYKSNLFINAYNLRLIGYGSLIMVFVFIVVGFITKKSRWAWAGAFVIFLPVFGQFALSMFFLSGLGVLRAGWLPFMEASFPILDLGMIIYVPYWIMMWFFELFNYYAKDLLSWFFMSTGSFLFVWGVFVWFQNRFGSKGVATQWIYKISRHPQYLGWIIWSYGLMIFSSTVNNMKKSWGDSTSFPWLLMTMIIIAMCMLEELTMREKYGKEYDEYRSSTPFLFPLPMWLKSIFKAPMKLVTKNRFPQNRKQVAMITLIYTVIFTTASLLWVDLGITSSTEVTRIENSEKVIDSISLKIQYTYDRRTLSHHFNELGNLGSEATDILVSYLSDPNPVVREFASNQLGRIKNKDAVQPLIFALNDENWRVRNSAANALTDIGDERAASPILDLVKSIPQNERSPYFQLLGSLGIDEAWPILIEGTQHQQWYARVSALKALAEINIDLAETYIYNSLKDDNVRVRRQAVFILLDKKPSGAVKPLQNMLDDEDYETRFYAEQAIRLIEQKNKH